MVLIFLLRTNDLALSASTTDLSTDDANIRKEEDMQSKVSHLWLVVIWGGEAHQLIMIHHISSPHCPLCHQLMIHHISSPHFPLCHQLIMIHHTSITHIVLCATPINDPPHQPLHLAFTPVFNKQLEEMKDRIYVVSSIKVKLINVSK